MLPFASDGHRIIRMEYGNTPKISDHHFCEQIDGEKVALQAMVRIVGEVIHRKIGVGLFVGFWVFHTGDYLLYINPLQRTCDDALGTITIKRNQ
jgi:hypothetical protein